jgi:hypothetical protein
VGSERVVRAKKLKRLGRSALLRTARYVPMVAFMTTENVRARNWRYEPFR